MEKEVKDLLECIAILTKTLKEKDAEILELEAENLSLREELRSHEVCGELDAEIAMMLGD